MTINYMNNVLKAKRYLAKSSARITDIKNVLRIGNPPSMLDLCNEAIELALRACLVLYGISSEKSPKNAIIDNEERFPSWFVDELRDILSVKEAPREILECLRRAEEIYDLVWKLIKKFKET